jgi:hypothetical protein
LKDILVEIALIEECTRARDLIFGRCVLERLMLVCQRVGVRRFFIQSAEIEQGEPTASLCVFRDNFEIVHVRGLSDVIGQLSDVTGCYRASDSRAYLLLLLILLGGFMLCIAAGNQARKICNDEWLAKIEQLTSRDFTYLLVVLALINRIHYFAWRSAIGAYVFALLLWLATVRRTRAASTVRQQATDESSAERASGLVNGGLLFELKDFWRTGITAGSKLRLTKPVKVRER